MNQLPKLSSGAGREPNGNSRLDGDEHQKGVSEMRKPQRVPLVGLDARSFNTIVLDG